MTLQNDDFFFSVSSWGTHLWIFFTFLICFKCWMTTEWSTLSSLATSHVIVRGSVLMILSVGCCQLPMASHYAPCLQGSSSALQNFLNHHCTVPSLAATGPKELLMLQVISTVLPFLNLNLKIAWIYFLSNITSIV